MKTVIPEAAHAKISFRLVAAQQPGPVVEAFRRWVDGLVPPGIAADGAVAYLCDELPGGARFRAGRTGHPAA